MSNPLSIPEHRHVFTYGSLMFETVWLSVVARHYQNQSAVLSGFRRHAVRGELYPALVKSPAQGSAVVGRLYRDVSSNDLNRLDAFEGTLYRRIACQVSEPASSTLIEAEVYLFLQPNLLMPDDWDEKRFAETGMVDFMKTYAPKP